MKPSDACLKLDNLSHLIKRSSEIIEVAGASPEEIYHSIDNFCENISKQILTIIPFSLEEYEANWADWKIAWKEHRELLIQFCGEELEGATKRKPKEGLPAYSKRLLFECHRKNLGNAWKAVLPKKQARESKFVEDQHAHELLRRWGGFSKEAFIADLKQTDQDSLERAAKALGIKVKTSAKSFPDKLYPAAVRFANNTTLF